jgi:hypothetical protein
MILKIEKHLQARVGEESFPVVLVNRLELFKALEQEEKLDAITCNLGDGVLSITFIRFKPANSSRTISTGWPVAGFPPHLLHFRHGESDHHSQPAVMRVHVPLRQAKIQAKPFPPSLQLRQLEIRRLKAPLHRRAVDELGVPVCDLKDAFTLLG